MRYREPYTLIPRKVSIRPSGITVPTIKKVNALPPDLPGKLQRRRQGLTVPLFTKKGI